MKHTAKTVNYNIKLAKKRLNTFSSRLGKNFDLDEEYFKSLSPKKADEELKKIRWSNTAQDKGGISYKGILIDNEPAPRRIKAEKKELTKEINKAERRLNSTGTKHTGLTYKLDREMLRNMNREEALKAAKSINYKSLKNDTDTTLSFVKTAYQKGTHPIGKYEYKTEIDDINRLTKAIINREIATGEVKPAKVYGKTAQNKVIEYYEFLNTKEKYEAFRRANAEMAENNLINNFTIISKRTSDRQTKAIAKAIVDWYHDGTLTIYNTPEELHDKSTIDMFDSEVPTEVMVASAEDIVRVILDNNVVSEEEIRKKLQSHGLNKYEIDEIITRRS